MRKLEATTADVTYCAEVILFLHMTSAALSLCNFFLCCIALDTILFFSQYYAPEHAEQDQIDTKWLERFISLHTCRRVRRSLITYCE